MLKDSIIRNWNKLFPKRTYREMFPARDDHQIMYRKHFMDIVDQYLIYVNFDEKKAGIAEYDIIVYVDSEGDIDWIIGDKVIEGEAAKKQFTEAISKLDIAQMLPIQNLSKSDKLNYKKILGSGYIAAINQNWAQVDQAIEAAKEYRNDRNKECSRFLLLSSATLYLFMALIAYLIFIHEVTQHPHFTWLTGMLMGTVGSYVSIWTRYGKMDMTGLGMRRLHYLESFSRMLIGSIFSMVLVLSVKVGVVFPEFFQGAAQIFVYCFLGFIAGFSEQLVPSVLESFTKSTKEKEK